MDTRIVELSKDARIRKEGDSYILINIATQGLHFISCTAYDFILRVNGIQNVSEIISEMWPNISSNDASVISNFVDKMIERRILIVK